LFAFSFHLAKSFVPAIPEMKLGAVKNKEAEVDWAAEFGEDDEFTVEESPEDDVEVEILLKENREQRGRASASSAGEDPSGKHKKPVSPTYSIRNGDMKLASALSVPATASMTIGRSGNASVEQVYNPVNGGGASPSSSMTSSAHFEPPMPRIDLDTHQVVSPSPYNDFIEIRNMSSTIKIISLVHLVRTISLYSPPPHTQACKSHA
jgi:hypothetical protein